MNYRTARANWTPTNWAAFCKQTLVDANQEYRRQLLSQATDEDLTAMYRELMKKRSTASEQDMPRIENQLRDLDRERVLRTAS